MELRTSQTSHGSITYWIEPESVGMALMYHHGMPSAGPCSPVLRSAAREAGFRLLQPVRPGYGTAPADPGYSIAEFGRRAAELAGTLSRDYAVMGLSAGGPFALATAAASPALGVGVIAGVGPLHEDLGDSEADRAETARYIESAKDREAVRTALQPEVDKVLVDAKDGLPDMRAKAIGLDAASLTPQRVALIAESLRWTFHLGIDGYVDDVIAIYSPWQFKLDSVTAPTQLHYGSADVVVPLNHGEAIKQRLKDAELIVYEGHGHTSISAHSFAAVVNWLGMLAHA